MARNGNRAPDAGPGGSNGGQATAAGADIDAGTEGGRRAAGADIDAPPEALRRPGPDEAAGRRAAQPVRTPMRPLRRGRIPGLWKCTASLVPSVGYERQSLLQVV